MRLADAGYATPAAMVIGLALALVAAAVVTRSLAELRLADQQFAKANIELELAAAQTAAAMALATSGQPPPYRWTIPILNQAVDVVAEPEAVKMSLTVASSGLDEATLSAFQVTDGADLTARLQALNARPGLQWISDQDSAVAWRDCVSTYISPYGQAASVTRPNYSDPDSGKRPAEWRSGEIWRVVAIRRDGWREDRIERFTGDQADPVAVIDRRVQKGKGGFRTCETLFG